MLEGQDPSIEPSAEIDVDIFFSVPIAAAGGVAKAGGARLLVEGRPFVFKAVQEGEIG